MAEQCKARVRRGQVSWLAGGVLAGVLAMGAVAPAAAQKAGGWSKVTPPAAAAARCTGYPGTDPSYSFFARKGSSHNLLLYFEGGGACWDSLTCTFPYDKRLPAEVPQFYSASLASGENPARLDGLFNLRRPDNPVKDWDMVYVPYCTGDLHSGQATQTYANVGHPVFPLPSLFDISHSGHANTMAVLDWVGRNVAAPERILVAGSSAGGYGASIHFSRLRSLYPSAQISVLADASQGVTTPTWDRSTPGRGSWNVQVPPGYPNADPATISGPELLRVGAQAFPEVRVAQFTTNLDLEQVQFYGAMKQYYPPGGSCGNLALDWNAQMVTTMRSYARTLPNYRHYLALGLYHTILTSDRFYHERSAGPVFNDWVAALVAGDDARWRNVACLGCLIQLPCPN